MAGAACQGGCGGHQPGQHRGQAGPEAGGSWLDWLPQGHPLPRFVASVPGKAGSGVPHCDQAWAGVRATGPRQKGGVGGHLQPASRGPSTLAARWAGPSTRVGSGGHPAGSRRDLASVSPGSEANHPDDKAAAPGSSHRGRAGQGRAHTPGSPESPCLSVLGDQVGSRSSHGRAFLPRRPPAPPAFRVSVLRGGAAGGRAGQVCVQSPGVLAPSAWG